MYAVCSQGVIILTYRPYADCQWNFIGLAQAKKYYTSRHLLKGISRFWKNFVSARFVEIEFLLEVL